MNNENNQGHSTVYVPAEKPYAVYAFVWECPKTEIAQLVGTLVTTTTSVDKYNAKKVDYEDKPVFRMVSDRMLFFDHCFIANESGEILDDSSMPLGFVGDTVSYDDIMRVKRIDIEYSDGDFPPKAIIRNMEIAGLHVKPFEEKEIDDLPCTIKSETVFNPDKIAYYLDATGEAEIHVTLFIGNKSRRAVDVFRDLRNQVDDFAGIGMLINNLKMKAGHTQYQEQVDELWELALLFGQYADSSSSQICDLIDCIALLGMSRCFYDDFVKALKKVYVAASPDKLLQWAVDFKLATRDGNLIQFSDDLYRMASWQWHIIEQET